MIAYTAVDWVYKDSRPTCLRQLFQIISQNMPQLQAEITY